MLKAAKTLPRSILAIESSFDDTCVALVDSNRCIKANASYNQCRLQQGFRGIIPELSAKVHKSRLSVMIPALLEGRGQSFDAIAVTRGPGLASSLSAGVDSARYLSKLYNVPLYGINHMAGHVLSVRLENRVSFPFIALVVSGGHTMSVLARGPRDFSVLGETLDDSVGEALDKAAHWLGLVDQKSPLSAAAQLESLIHSNQLTQQNVIFPDAMNDASCDFSFAGLKTELQRKLMANVDRRLEIAAAFQDALFCQIRRKFVKALHGALRVHQDIRSISLCGGVARNKRLQNMYSLSSLISLEFEILPKRIRYPSLCLAILCAQTMRR